MSIKMIPGAARLTVLGSGWNNSSIESGDGLTEEGKLWEDIAGDLGYDYGGSVDWDNISTIYPVDYDGVIEDDDGNRLVPLEDVLALSLQLNMIAAKDTGLRKYSIKSTDIKNLYGGPVSSETSWEESDPERPHTYAPPVYYIQTGKNTAYLFYKEPFYHYTADGGKVEVKDKSIEVRSGSSMKVYWSSCSTHFSDNYLPAPYNSYPIEYVCWQCLYGSFGDVTIATTDSTLTEEDIKNSVGSPVVVIDGKHYVVLKQNA